jgi:hypothetical protein
LRPGRQDVQRGSPFDHCKEVGTAGFSDVAVEFTAVTGDDVFWTSITYWRAEVRRHSEKRLTESDLLSMAAPGSVESKIEKEDVLFLVDLLNESDLDKPVGRGERWELDGVELGGVVLGAALREWHQ